MSKKVEKDNLEEIESVSEIEQAPEVTNEAKETEMVTVDKALLYQLMNEVEQLKAERKVLSTQTQAEPTGSRDDVTAYLNERVPFKAFKDNDKYKDDIFVSVNGKGYQIKRGELVYIPRHVLMAIEDSERQRLVSAKHSQGLIDTFMEESKKRGIM